MSRCLIVTEERCCLKAGLWFLILLILTACGGAPATVDPTPPAAPTFSPTDSAPVGTINEDIIARVNGVEIPRLKFERALARSQRDSVIADQGALERAVLETLIEQEVINQGAAQLGIVVTEAQIDQNVQEMIAQAGSESAWQAWMDQNLYTESEYREAAREQLLTVQVVEQVIAQAVATPEVGVTQVRARHILVSTEAQARDVLARLANGESFESLALQFSRDVTTRESGGDLGFFVREDLTTPELADVAFTLQPNEIAGPIVTDLGYHILQTLEFGSAETALSPEAAAERHAALFNVWLEGEFAGAVIERYLN